MLRVLNRAGVKPSLNRRVASSLFSTTSATSQIFLVVAHDYSDPDALSRRMAVRQRHLDRLHEYKIRGYIGKGGALLADETAAKPKMIGSFFLVDFPNQEEVQQFVDEDPYIEGRVWDKSRVQIMPIKVVRM
ncbi:hypothetical protein RI367_003976 [Sorochytrium milnesiophthora]